MDQKESKSIEILALFSSFREKRIRLYDSFVRDINDFHSWSIPIERLLAYYITIRNLRKHGGDLKAKVQKEIIRLTEGDFTLH